MVSVTDARAAVINRILGMTTSANIMQPNAAVTKDLPRYVIQNAGGLNQTATLCGTTRAEPEILVLVETMAGEFTTEHDAMVQALFDLFPTTKGFDGVRLLQPLDTRPPYVNGSIYTTPVYIRVFTSF